MSITREVLGVLDALPGTTPWQRVTRGMPRFEGADHAVHYGGILEKDWMAATLQRAMRRVDIPLHVAQTGRFNLDSDRAAIQNLAGVVDAASAASLREGGSGDISLVGHSRGGVISLEYAKGLDDHQLARVRQIVALGSPFDGVELFEPSLSGFIRDRMPLESLKNLIYDPATSAKKADEFVAFMDRYRAIVPDGRVVSLMGDRGNGSDGLVANIASRLPDVPGAHNVVIGGGTKGAGPDHNSIGGTVAGMHDESFRTLAYLLAGRDVPDALLHAQRGARHLQPVRA